jgi:hypothetical protein
MSPSNPVAISSPAPFQVREAIRFLVTIVLILVPTLICFGILEAVAWRVGETWSMEAIANWQSLKADRMWRGGDGRSYLTYKVARVRSLRPEVIMLGQSRANFFVADMVKPYTFYNAGLTAWTFDQYLRFLELITTSDYAPKVLFFNLDYWMFNKDFDHYWVDRFYERAPTHVEDLKIILDEILKEPRVLLRRLPAAEEVKGIYAVRNGDGFRQDGSLDPIAISRNATDLAHDGIEVGKPPTVLGMRLDDEQVAAFERLVAYAKSKNIVLIGIQVPFYAKVLNGLNNEPWAGLWRKFESEPTRAYFRSQGVIFFDFADMPEYRDNPENFVDSVHPGPRVVKDIAGRMLRDPRVRAVLPNLRGGA